MADVDEVPPGEMDVPPTGTGDLTLGYNTAEAVPMTLYYRQSADTADNKPRPTLDHLREGRTDTMNQSLTAEVSTYQPNLCVFIPLSVMDRRRWTEVMR